MTLFGTLCGLAKQMQCWLRGRGGGEEEVVVMEEEEEDEEEEEEEEEQEGGVVQGAESFEL